MKYVAGQYRSSNDLYDATIEIYKKIFNRLSAEYPYLIRCHHYIPDINSTRYDAFNKARRVAFKDAGYLFHPAATALGAPTGDNLVISFLIGQTAPIELSNSRQVDAFDYPIDNTPLFARAVIADDQLYVSGTASIIGHQSVHLGDVVAQYKETMANIIELAGSRLVSLNWVIYVKDSADVDIIRTLHPYSAKYIVCDICRDELLIEIEATEKNGKDISSLYT